MRRINRQLQLMRDRLSRAAKLAKQKKPTARCLTYGDIAANKGPSTATRPILNLSNLGSEVPSDKTFSKTVRFADDEVIFFPEFEENVTPKRQNFDPPTPPAKPKRILKD